VLLVAASFCDREKFCTHSDHVHRYDGSRSTYLHYQGVGRVSSPSDLRIVSCGTDDLRGPSDLLGPAVLTSRSSFFLDGPLPRDFRSRAQASEASMHMSVTASGPVTVLGFFMAISSTVLISLTPLRKVLMISMSWMCGMTFLALQKYLT
jgi:hypothetical protein